MLLRPAEDGQDFEASTDLAGWRGSYGVGLPSVPFHDLPALGRGESKMSDSTWTLHNATKANLCAFIFHRVHFLSWQFTFHYSGRPTSVFWFHTCHMSLLLYAHMICILSQRLSSFLAFALGFSFIFVSPVFVAAKVLLQHRAQHLRATRLATSRRRWSVANVVDQGSRDVGLGRWSAGLGRGAGELRAIGEEKVKGRNGRKG